VPIYEYVCRACGKEMERLQKLSDADLTDCPQCGQSALKRKVSAAGFRLAGSGWYETDFKTDGRRNLAGDSGGKAGADSSKGESAGSGDSSGGKKKSASTGGAEAGSA